MPPASKNGSEADTAGVLQLDEQLSTAILRQARDQQAELNREDLAGRGLSGITQASTLKLVGQATLVGLLYVLH